MYYSNAVEEIGENTNVALSADDWELTEEEAKAVGELVDPDAPAKPTKRPRGEAKEPSFDERLEVQRKDLPDDLEIQKNMVGMIMTEPEWVASIRQTVKPEYFADEAHQTIVAKVFEYWDKYGSVPPRPVILNEIHRHVNEQFKGNVNGPEVFDRYTKEVLACSTFYVPNADSQDYLRDQIVNFAKMQGVRDVGNQIWKQIKERKVDVESLATDLLKVGEIGLGESAFASFDAAEYLDHAASIQRDFLVPEWLARGYLTLFAGREKLGKSTVVFSLIPALISGGNWLGRPEFACTKSHVVYLDFENPEDYVSANLLQYMGEEAYRQHRQYLHVPRKLPATGLTGAWLEGYLKANNLTEATEPVVIVIDSARAALGPLCTETPNWESVQSEVRRVLTPLTAVARKHNAALLCVHHHNKSGQRSGSTDWGGAVDITWDYEHKTENTRTLKIGGRILAHPQKLLFSLNDNKVSMGYDSGDESALIPTSQPSVDGEAAIMGILPRLDPADVNVTTGLTYNQIRDRLAELTPRVNLGEKRIREVLKQPRVLKKSGPNKNSPTLYYLD